MATASNVVAILFIASLPCYYSSPMPRWESSPQPSHHFVAENAQFIRKPCTNIVPTNNHPSFTRGGSEYLFYDQEPYWRSDIEHAKEKKSSFLEKMWQVLGHPEISTMPPKKKEKKWSFGLVSLFTLIFVNLGLQEDPAVARTLARWAAALIYLTAGCLALYHQGVDMAPVAKGLGLTGFLVGFAFKELATHFLAGLLLVLQRPFRTGWIIRAGDYQGQVKKIDARHVKLINSIGEVVLLPTYTVWANPIIIVDDLSGQKHPPVAKVTPTMEVDPFQ